MDVSAISKVTLNSAALGPATDSFSRGNDVASLRANDAANFANTLEASRSAAQPSINSNSVSLNATDQPFDVVRSAISDLMVRGQSATGAERRGEGQLVKSIDPAGQSALVKDIGDVPETQISGLGNYKAAMEYAIHANMVGMVLQGVTKGITALTSRG